MDPLLRIKYPSDRVESHWGSMRLFTRLAFPHLGNGFKAAIVVNRKQIIFHCYLSNAAIDWAVDGISSEAQVNVNADSSLRRLDCESDIILCFEVGGESD